MKSSGWFAFALALGVTASWCEHAVAQEAPPPAPVAPAAPDVVVLKNGGLIRGTISESMPDSHVIILTLTGETKRFTMAEVSYAGPANEQPARPASPVVDSVTNKNDSADNVQSKVIVHAKEARLALRADAHVTFHLRDSTAQLIGASGHGVAAAGYSEVCTTPCEVSLPAGTHTLALSEAGSSPVEAEPVTIPEGPATLTAKHKNNQGTRTVGRVIMVGGLVVGSGVGLLAAANGGESRTPLYAGLGVMIGGVLVGGVLMLQTDSAEVTVTPGLQTAAGKTASADVRLDLLAEPRGLTITARF